MRERSTIKKFQKKTRPQLHSPIMGQSSCFEVGTFTDGNRELRGFHASEYSTLFS